MLIVASIILVPTTNLRADAGCLARVQDCEALNSKADALIATLEKQSALQIKLNEALEDTARIATQRYYENLPAWYEKPSFLVPATVLTTIVVYGLTVRALPPR